jgi:hypothetical protein
MPVNPGVECLLPCLSLRHSDSATTSAAQKPHHRDLSGRRSPRILNAVERTTGVTGDPRTLRGTRGPVWRHMHQAEFGTQQKIARWRAPTVSA